MTKRAAASCLALAAACLTLALAARRASGSPDSGDAARVRGEYLVTIGGCNDCHTPLEMGPDGPEPDMTRRLAGHPAEVPLEPVPQIDPASPWNWSGFATLTAFAGPWGVSVSRNLTPDAETGLGSWSEEQFVRAMRTGRHQGVEDGRPILPPMPWQGIARMTDDDLHAMWIYLRSIPPIRNASPQSIPAPAAAHVGH